MEAPIADRVEWKSPQIRCAHTCWIVCWSSIFLSPWWRRWARWHSAWSQSLYPCLGTRLAAGPACVKVEEVGTLILRSEPLFEQNTKAAAMAQDDVAPLKPAALYERIGGVAAVKATVDVFYDKVMQGSLLVPYFEVSTYA
ncbi:hypothetical protein DUNSADRAFT_7473 [Dunaliella salina]|uniref:Uncharacterized protein n=1 Tax=Dunaliella salina TaxID=3046 RepID=A0ABQ7GLD8_DUNSA|nr:hypothetical protein DUNSADRAFT_7473 [Dunaliella salina]|eukprot:KAF5835388.1 hypothetical protein DUNSADRAFT_7473 [Dunaliella salina]